MLNRRAMMTTLAASGLLAAAPLSGLARAAASPRTGRLGSPVRPPRLRPGDTLGLIAPAGFLADRFGLDELGTTVRAMGLEPRFAPHLTARDGYLAGSDAARAADLMAMFTDDGVRAIMTVRGGWGCARILPLLDWQALRRHPKLLVGSSDVTALHCAIAARAGFVTLHAPNAAASWPNDAWESFRAVAFEGETPTYTTPQAMAGGLGRRTGMVRTFRKGSARGRLFGGNLSVLSALCGTPYLPDLTGAILFLEDTNEAEYRIDRMLTQLRLAGVLDGLAGVVFGQCTDCENPGPSWGNLTVYDVMDRNLAPLGVPAFQGPRIGHVADQITLPIGTMAEIDAEKGTITLLEAAVA